MVEFFLEHKFNGIRLPFSLEFALSPMDEDDTGIGEVQYPDREKISPEYYDLTSWEIVDLLFEKCAEHGILILLDMHTLDPDKGISRLWYDPEKYSEAQVVSNYGWVVRGWVGGYNRRVLGLWGNEVKGVNGCGVVVLTYIHNTTYILHLHTY